MLSAPVVVFYLLVGLVTPQGAAPAQAGQQVPPPAPAPSIVQALPLDPAHRSALQSALDRHDYKAAESLLVSEVQRSAKSKRLLTFLGSVAFLNGDYLNAAIALKKAEALSPLDNRDRFTLAMAYVTLEQPDWARPELEKLAHSGEKNPLYPYWLSRLDYNDMNFESALANARSAIELNPAFMKAYDNLGLVYEALGKSDEAIKAYQQAIALNRQMNPRSPWPAMNLGALLLKLDRRDEAEAVLRESLNCDPRFPKAHFWLGLLLEKEKKFPEAIHELEQAADYDPNYPEPYYVLGKIYKRIGEDPKAQQAWSRYRELEELKSRKARLRKQSR
jgi:tetratricopeptide (TPR) repeat protein